MIVGERLKGFLKQHNFTAKEFANMVGVSEGMVYKYYKMDNVDSGTVNKWADVLHVPLLTFLDDDMYKRIVVPKTPEEIQDIHKEHLKRIEEHENFELFKQQGISSLMELDKANKQPIIDIRVCAGNGIGLEGEENKIMDWVSIPAFKGCTGIMVFGDSMYDKYQSGDVIFVRPIQGRDDVDYGQCYVIITREDRYIKNLYESAKGDKYVTMVSYNMELNPDGRRKFPDRDISKNEILFLYKVAGKLRRNQL